MIPKVIHYCWFGNNPLPDLALKCLNSWKTVLTDYEIVLWNENNFDLNCCSYVKEAYDNKKWAFVSDYARLKIIYENGGIYLDTDVEVVRSFDDLLINSCFFGTEPSGYIATGLGFGAVKGDLTIKKMLDEYRDKHFVLNGVFDTTPCPVRNTLPLVNLGFKYSKSDVWKNNGITVFPPTYFCPKDYVTGELIVSDYTYSIHHYSALWLSESDLAINSEIDRITNENSKLIAKLKIHLFLYKRMKSEKKVKNIFDYIIKKISVRSNR